jgi:hypothetical protein
MRCQLGRVEFAAHAQRAKSRTSNAAGTEATLEYPAPEALEGAVDTTPLEASSVDTEPPKTG